jgi:hypothetical protein
VVQAHMSVSLSCWHYGDLRAEHGPLGGGGGFSPVKPFLLDQGV